MSATCMHASVLAVVALTEIAGCSNEIDAKPIVPGGSGFVYPGPRITRIDKLDLLLVVDNSISMADKQAELSRRMPEMIASLTDRTPDPVTGKVTSIVDVHVAVITSSLGSHGTSACSAEAGLPSENDDHGRLLPRVGQTLSGGYQVASPTADPVAAACPALVAASPLTWVFDPTKEAQFKGAAGATSLQIATACSVASANESGCGYEETWEAMFHFLIDPAPYASAKVSCTFGPAGDACANNSIVIEGIDEEVLTQRAAFLRPDSLVAVIILSDENDFSLKPAGLNWLPWGWAQRTMQRGWGNCATVPDDFEPEGNAERQAAGCFSCFENNSDPNCSVPWATDPVNNDVDGRNLRGFHQLQRYGYNFLWSRQRYVDAFTKPQVLGSDGKLGANPLFRHGVRTSDLIVVAAIVGVPKHLLEDGAGKLLKHALAPAAWDKIVGPVDGRDPHMVESIAPRAAVPKFAGDRSIDPAHGGDRDIVDGDDLQYACIGPRSTTEPGIECQSAGAASTNPLCAPGGSQPYFKAYPGLRHLRIVRELGISGFAASICSGSYRPAIQAVTAKIKTALGTECIQSDITPREGGNVDCVIAEALKEGTFAGKTCEQLAPGRCTPGAAPCRREGDANHPPMSPESAAERLTLPITVVGADGIARTATTAKVENGNVIVEGEDGRKHLVCELLQLAGGRVAPAITTACINDPAFTLPPSQGGWCYSQTPAVVGEICIAKRALSTIRYLGQGAPMLGAEVFTLCVKAP